MIKAATTCAMCLALAAQLAAQDTQPADPAEAARQSGMALMRSSAAALTDPAMGQLIEHPTATTTPAVGQVIEVRREAPVAVEAPQPAPATKPSPATQEVAATKPAPQSQPAAELSADELAAIALQKAKSDEPLTLADELYAAGKHKAAAIFYEQATTQAKAPADTEWAMFQLANCKSQVDEAAAAALYRQFLQQYPKSTWSDAATARVQLLAWRQSQAKAQVAKGAGK